MQQKESIMVALCEQKFLSLGITVRCHSASLMMLNSYPSDRIFNPHLTTIKDSYTLRIMTQPDAIQTLQTVKFYVFLIFSIV